MEILLPAWLVKLILVALGGYVTFGGVVIAMQAGWAGKMAYMYTGIPIAISGVAAIIFGIVS